MGNVNAPDRVINIFPNYIIVYRQSTWLGQGPRWWLYGEGCCGVDLSIDSLL